MSASEQSITAIISMLLLTASQLKAREKEQSHRIKSALPKPALPAVNSAKTPSHRESCFHWVINPAVLRDPQTALLTQNLLIQSLGYLAIGERFTIRLSGKTVDWVLFRQPELATVDTLLRARHAILQLCSGLSPRDSGFTAVSPETKAVQIAQSITVDPSHPCVQLQIMPPRSAKSAVALASYRIDSLFDIKPQLSKLFDRLSELTKLIDDHHDEEADELSAMVGLLLRLCAVHWWWYYDQCDRPEPAVSRAIAA